MPVSPHWKLVDVFTLEQAAYLWCGMEPQNLAIAYKPPGEVNAIYQALVAAAKLETIQIDSSKNHLAGIGQYYESLVARDTLIRFAKSKNAYPAFLFDTLSAPENPTPSAATTQAKPSPLPPNQARAPSQSLAEPPAEPVNRGGRPEGYDWNACMAEIVRLADMDGLPAVQNELVRHLIEWFEERHGNSPADSVIKARISPIYRYLKSVGWKPQDS
jgi:hypothetical protein